MTYGKLMIRCEMEVRTGMHIGGSSGFSAIGAVDSPVIRDPRTGDPIVPGSSLKGKLRTLLARSYSFADGKLERLPDIDSDDERIKRLFGAAKPKVIPSRLQFADAFVSNKAEMQNVGLTEVKTENGINRSNSVANPRQVERVVAGTKFAVCIVYNIVDGAQTEADMEILASGFKLLQMDYLGGHGSRGSGRVSLHDFQVTSFDEAFDAAADRAEEQFKEVEAYELLPV
ncbi:MAG: type III-A CRISPR-associated RAMP protein Csm3 [Clostridiales bacterium]|nr:type III-A CRISPR-associated RAMP protein Csm3 [Clostridiales bacterium]